MIELEIGSEATKIFSMVLLEMKMDIHREYQHLSPAAAKPINMATQCSM